MKGTVLDPATKRSVAFYVALAIGAMAAHKELNYMTGGFLLLLAGVAGVDSWLTRGAK